MGWQVATTRGTVGRSGVRLGSRPKFPVTRSKGPLRSLRLPVAALAASLACLLAPATGQAAVTVFGSDMTKPANIVEDHGADAAFWNISIDGDSGRGVVPADGQITVANVKGTVLADPTGRAKPDPQFHIQVLHPLGNGSVRVDLSSGAFRLPVGGDPQQVSSFKPVNLCVHRGDYVDFNDIGGNEWHWGPFDGMPFQVFSRVPGSTTDFYSADNGTNNGSQWQPAQSKRAEELLMQTTLKTGPDATDICPGGYMQHIFKGAQIRPGQNATVRTRARYVKVRVLCPGPSYGYCAGTMTLQATIGARKVVLGSAQFKITPSTTPSVQISLSKPNVKLIQKAKVVSVKAVADTHDAPGASSSGADPSVPVQSRQTSEALTLRPDKTLQQSLHKHRHH